MTLDTKKLRDLANAATPGPWRWRFGCVEQLSDAGKGYPLDTYPDCDTIQESQCHECGTAIGLGERNGEFVAAANPATVIALLDEIDEAKRLVATWQTHSINAADKRSEALGQVTRLKQQLSAITAARDELADMCDDYERTLSKLGHYDGCDTDISGTERIAALRKVGQ